MAKRARAVFLDRDGTLVRDVKNGADPAALELLTGAVVALSALQRHGYLLVVVTNQSGVARGLFTQAEAIATGARLAALLAARGVEMDAYFICPHYEGGTVPEFAVACDCRKPQPGMLLLAADELGIDLSRSWMMGDSLADVAAGRAAGARSILVDAGTLRQSDPIPADTVIARNLAHAATIALARDGRFGKRLPPHLYAPLCIRDLPKRRVTDGRNVGEVSRWPDAGWAVRADSDAALLMVLTAGGARLFSRK